MPILPYREKPSKEPKKQRVFQERRSLTPQSSLKPEYQSSSTDTRPNDALLFAKIFIQELFHPSEPSEPTLTDPMGSFSYDLSKPFPTIKEENGTRRDQSLLSPEDQAKLADYEQAVVKHRFTKRVFAVEGLKLEQGLVELQAWETDEPRLVEAKNTPEVGEIIAGLRRKVIATQLVLEEYGQHALVAKAHDNARTLHQQKGKQQQENQ